MKESENLPAFRASEGQRRELLMTFTDDSETEIIKSSAQRHKRLRQTNGIRLATTASD